MKLTLYVVNEEKINRDDLLKVVGRDLPLTLLTFKYSFQKDKTCLKIEDAVSLLSDEELKFIYFKQTIDE